MLDAEVVLPDHVHAIWSLPEGDCEYSTRWMLIKSAFTRRIGELAHRAKPVVSSRSARRERAIWQSRFWEHLIRDDRDYFAHADYIHYNPVKHGLVRSAIDWPHSTFKSFVERQIYAADWGVAHEPVLPVRVDGDD